MWKSLALVGVVIAASAATPEPSVRPTPRVFPSFEALPGADDPSIAALWRQALQLEAARENERAAEIYEGLAARFPSAGAPRWMAARCYWNYARRLPPGDSEERRQALRQTGKWAEQGIEVDPECGECHLYAAAALGGELRQRSAVAGALEVSEIASLLERGIALIERLPDAERNSELEDLYYAAAQLYRRFPDSGILRWALGVPGDRRRAVTYMRRAFVLGGQRPDRGVELGALLLCAGDAEDDPALAAEGEQLLRRLGGGDLGAADGVRQRAAALLEQPSAACDDAP